MWKDIKNMKWLLVVFFVAVIVFVLSITSLINQVVNSNGFIDKESVLEEIQLDHPEYIKINKMTKNSKEYSR